MPVSYEFTLVLVSDVHIEEGRQRQEKKKSKIEELGASIERNGLLHPIIVKRDLTLVAGERRWLAHKHLGRLEIPVHFLDELDPFEAKAIELEENLKRVDLTWQESCLAARDYHSLRADAQEDWTRKASADMLGITPQHMSQLLLVANALIAKNELVVGATNFEMARRVILREQKRAVDTEFAQIDLTILDVEAYGDEPASSPISLSANDLTEALMASVPTAPKKKEPAEKPKAKAKTKVENLDFVAWIQSYKGRKFNFLHCDFPYGISLNSTTYNGSKAYSKYDDSKEVYFALLENLCEHHSKILFPSSHLMFWYSMNYHCETVRMLTEAGFVVNPYPLIWHKDRGIVPDPQRGPKRVYETALFASLGDRRVIRSPLNTIYGVVKKEGHLSTKPRPILHHFFRMFVDNLTEMLDPTCGSGTALASAIALGAKRVHGLDIDEAHVETSRLHIEEALRQDLKTEESNDEN